MKSKCCGARVERQIWNLNESHETQTRRFKRSKKIFILPTYTKCHKPCDIEQREGEEE